LASGCARAAELRQRGLIHAAYLALQGEVRAVLPAGTLIEPAARRSAGG